MDILIIIVLILAAIGLFLVELFILPGISLAAILSAACALYANYYAFTHLGAVGGFITLGVTIVAGVGSLVAFMRSKTLSRIALKENIDSQIDRSAEDSLQVGDHGIALTRLALIGQAEINGKVVEVKSADGFLDEKTPVIVCRIADGFVMVKRYESDK